MGWRNHKYFLLLNWSGASEVSFSKLQVVVLLLPVLPVQHVGLLFFSFSIC